MPDAKTTVPLLQIQLIGVVGVLSVLLIIVIPITVVLSGVKGNTTLSHSNTGAFFFLFVLKCMQALDRVFSIQETISIFRYSELRMFQ